MSVSLPVIRTAIAIVWGNWLIDRCLILIVHVQVEFNGSPELA